MTRDEPLFPVDGSVATMVLTPGETAVTNPALFTVATAALLLLHTTVGLVSRIPPASVSSAVNWRVACATSTGSTGSTAMRATLDTTFTMAVAVTPSAVAVMVAEPMDSAVTCPAAVTVAMLGSSVRHATATPVTPESTTNVGVSVALPPTVRDAGTPVIARDCTPITCNTVLPRSTLGPSTVTAAVMAVWPRLTPFTAPRLSTVATVGADELHVTRCGATCTSLVPTRAPSTNTSPRRRVAFGAVTRTSSGTNGATMESPAQEPSRMADSSTAPACCHARGRAWWYVRGARGDA